MHLTKIFETQNNDTAMNFIEKNSFGDLVTLNKDMLCSNKVPFFLDRESGTLCGHVGRENSQLLDIEESAEVLVIFTGAQSYISPQWYVSENSVPTWNFQTAQVRGKATIVDDNRLLTILNKLSAFHESQFDQPWSIANIDPKKRDFMLKMITGFEIKISDIKFKEKMSQNRNRVDQQSIINSLNKQNKESTNAVSSIMQEKYANTADSDR